MFIILVYHAADTYGELFACDTETIIQVSMSGMFHFSSTPFVQIDASLLTYFGDFLT